MAPNHDSHAMIPQPINGGQDDRNVHKQNAAGFDIVSKTCGLGIFTNETLAGQPAAWLKTFARLSNI
jgi:hypothetical protein